MMACARGLQGLHELMHSAPHTGPSMSYFLSASLLLEKEETDTGPRKRGSIFTSHEVMLLGWPNSFGHITATCLKEKCGIWPGTSSWDLFSKWESTEKQSPFCRYGNRKGAQDPQPV